MSLENTQQCGINSGAQQSRQWIARKEKSVDPNLSSCVGTSRALRKNSIFVVKALGRDWRFLFLRWGLHLRQERELGRKPLTELRDTGETREKVWWVGGVDIEFAFFFFTFSQVWCVCVCMQCFRVHETFTVQCASMLVCTWGSEVDAGSHHWWLPLYWLKPCLSVQSRAHLYGYSCKPACFHFQGWKCRQVATPVCH